MRILFSASPVGGHLLPLLPMAHAARQQGHQAAVLTSRSVAELVDPLPLLAAGPDFSRVVAETRQLLGAGWNGPGPEAARMFAQVRVDLSFDDAVAQGRAFQPELIICEAFDFVGPTLAAALEVPWATLAISGSLPPTMVEPMGAFGAEALRSRGLAGTERLCLFDPYPDVLEKAPFEASDRRPIQPEPLPGSRPAPTLDDLGLPAGPRVLLSLGTSAEDQQLPGQMAADLAAAGVVVVATHDQADDLPYDERVRWIGFTPLGGLLAQVDAVVSLGGTGTVLASLWAGVPLALQPTLADQPLNAARVATLGAGRVVDETTTIGSVAVDVATAPVYRSVARQVRDVIRRLPRPGDALATLVAEVGAF